MTDHSTDTAAIKALCKAQAEMTGAIKSETNPAFRSKYADLGAVQGACFPALHKHGFAVLHHTGRDDDDRYYLETTLMHESGGSFSCRVPLRVDKDNMQGIGSAFTYARKYGLMCVSSVAPEDDDGNSATANPPKGRDNGSRVIATAFSAPLANQARAAITSDDDREATRVISVMGTITDIKEFRAFWDSLVDSQPRIAKRPDVIAAKDDRKAVIGGGKGAV